MIKRIYDYLFYSCQHEFKIIDVVKIHDRMFYPEDLPIRLKYVLQCKKCGEIKTQKI